MVICFNCKQTGGYYEQDGLYYCNRCDTQSQTMQVMDAEEERVTTKVSIMHSHKIKKKEVHKTNKNAPSIKMQFHKKTIPGAWKYETMQLILEAQVKTLVDMGVAPRLKDVVGHLWFLYLQKLNIAFYDDSPQTGDSKNRKRKEAEENMPKETTEDSEPGSPSLISRKIYKLVKSPESTATESTDVMLSNPSSSIAEDQSMNDSNDDERGAFADKKSAVNEPSDDGAVDDADEHAATANNTKDTAPAEINGKKSTKKKTSETIMTPSVYNLLCLVYMGLRYIHEPILLCDIIRLVHDNDLPFRYAGDIIPRELAKKKENQTEFKRLFCNTYRKKCTLKHAELIKRLQVLHGLMNLPVIPSPDMAVVIARFVASLNLPKELNQYTYKLFSDFKPTLDSRVVAHDIIAMAFIIVALRLLFILDDNTEHRMSVRAQRLRSIMSPEVPVFVWDRWVCVVNLRNEQRISDGLTTDASEVHQVRNVDQFLSNYLQCSRVEDYKDLDMKNERDKWTWREERQKCFRVVEKDIATEDNPGESVQSRATSKGKRKRATSHSRDKKSRKKPKKETILVRKQMVLPMEHSEIKWESTDELVNVDFSQHSMQYLLDFDKFCLKYELTDNQHWLVTGQRECIVDENWDDDKKGQDEQSKLARKEEDSSALNPNCNNNNINAGSDNANAPNPNSNNDTEAANAQNPNSNNNNNSTVANDAIVQNPNSNNNNNNTESTTDGEDEKRKEASKDDKGSKGKSKKQKKKLWNSSVTTKKRLNSMKDADWEEVGDESDVESKSKVKKMKKLTKKSDPNDASEDSEQKKATESSHVKIKSKKKKKKKMSKRMNDVSTSKKKIRKTKKKVKKKSSEDLEHGIDGVSNKNKSKGTDGESKLKMKAKKKTKQITKVDANHAEEIDTTNGGPKKVKKKGKGAHNVIAKTKSSKLRTSKKEKKTSKSIGVKKSEISKTRKDEFEEKEIGQSGDESTSNVRKKKRTKNKKIKKKCGDTSEDLEHYSDAGFKSEKKKLKGPNDQSVLKGKTKMKAKKKLKKKSRDTSEDFEQASDAGSKPKKKKKSSKATDDGPKLQINSKKKNGAEKKPKKKMKKTQNADAVSKSKLKSGKIKKKKVLKMDRNTSVPSPCDQFKIDQIIAAKLGKNAVNTKQDAIFDSEDSDEINQFIEGLPKQNQDQTTKDTRMSSEKLSSDGTNFDSDDTCGDDDSIQGVMLKLDLDGIIAGKFGKGADTSSKKAVSSQEQENVEDSESDESVMSEMVLSSTAASSKYNKVLMSKQQQCDLPHTNYTAIKTKSKQKKINKKKCELGKTMDNNEADKDMKFKEKKNSKKNSDKSGMKVKSKKKVVLVKKGIRMNADHAGLLKKSGKRHKKSKKTTLSESDTKTKVETGRVVKDSDAQTLKSGTSDFEMGSSSDHNENVSSKRAGSDYESAGGICKKSLKKKRHSTKGKDGKRQKKSIIEVGEDGKKEKKYGKKDKNGKMQTKSKIGRMGVDEYITNVENNVDDTKVELEPNLSYESTSDASKKSVRKKDKKSTKKGKDVKKQKKSKLGMEEDEEKTNSHSSNVDLDDTKVELEPNLDDMPYQMLKDTAGKYGSEDLPKSFVWLVSHCAWLLQVEPKNLYQAICDVELLIFNSSDWKKKMKRNKIVYNWGCQK